VIPKNSIVFNAEFTFTVQIFDIDLRPLDILIVLFFGSSHKVFFAIFFENIADILRILVIINVIIHFICSLLVLLGLIGVKNLQCLVFFVDRHDIFRFQLLLLFLLLLVLAHAVNEKHDGRRVEGKDEQERGFAILSHLQLENLVFAHEL
jgi:hypothetical protein